MSSPALPKPPQSRFGVTQHRASSLSTPSVVTPTRSSRTREDGGPPISRTPSADGRQRPRLGNDIALQDLSRATTHEATTAPPIDLPHPDEIHLARNLPDFERKLGAQRARVPGAAQRAAAADILNQVRHNPLAANAGTTPTHAELAQRLTDERLEQFLTGALQMTPQKLHAMESMAAKGGRYIPSSGSLFQALLYGVIPFAGLASTPTKVLIGSGAALAAQPFVTAALQTPIVSAITVMRQKGAPMGKMPGNLKANTSLPQIEAKLERLNAAAQADAEAMQTLMASLAQSHPGQALPADQPPTEQRMSAFFASLSQDEHDALADIQQRQTVRAIEAAALVVDGLRLEGMQARQKNSTRAQVWLRTARGASSILAPALQAAKWSTPAITGVSVVLALAALLGQHIAAGKDEKTARTDELKLSILYGDLFNAIGQADWEAGRPITGDGIDEKKLQALLTEPETTIAGRVKSMVEGRQKELEARLQALPPAEGPALEAGNEVATQLAARIQGCKDEVALIDSGKLTDLPQDSFARQLFNQSMESTAVAFAATEGWNKLRAPLEYSAQVGQRLSQQFTYGLLGGAGALALGRGVNAVVYEVNKHHAGQHPDPAHAGKPIPGMSGEAAWAQVLLTLGAAAIAFYSAISQYSAVNVKNARRDGAGGDPGLADQLKNGVMSPGWQSQANRAAAGARTVGDAVLQASWRSTAAMRSALDNG
ncbi:hypothetical protein [Rhizobacter sp. OV335]|uniref:hypothetical protein n=1 Tax=Rhizobacter sp. OV335 TaxID=1500264 RepID=UPI00091D0F2F|nr:hypothetical protein [Rhizobacter sp. OV335]SHN09432.1 hypothetical protein SAMN02787076_03279 [Rhizobacter sp. OV335]